MAEEELGPEELTALEPGSNLALQLCIVVVRFANRTFPYVKFYVCYAEGRVAHRAAPLSWVMRGQLRFPEPIQHGPPKADLTICEVSY